MTTGAPRRLFTATEYERMVAAGILSEDERVELIGGNVVRMFPKGSRHAACVDRVAFRLSRLVGDQVIIRVQSPIRLDNFSEPEPDIALLRFREDFYKQAHPTPDDVLLIIEVADTSYEYDRGVKLRQYARALILAVLIAYLPGGSVGQFAQPVDGVYQIARRFVRGQSITSVSLPDLTLSVDDILG